MTEGQTFRAVRNNAICFQYRYGDDVQEIADDFGLNRARIYQILRQEGEPLRKRVGPGKADKPDERAEQIIELRRAGKTYREIGDQLGISRERVRQILNRWNQTDLIGYGTQIGLIPLQRVEVTCPICGKTKSVIPSVAHYKYCSSKCAHLGTGYTKYHERAPVVYRMRLEGKSWKAIAAHFGINYPDLHRGLRRWCEETGTKWPNVRGRTPGANPPGRRPSQ